MFCLTETCSFLTTGINSGRRFKSPRVLRRGSVATRFRGLRVRIPPAMSVVSVVCCPLPEERYRVQCFVTECRPETSAVRRHRLTRTVKPVFRQAFIEDTRDCV